MKTSELTGAALDWAVHVALHGSCEGYAEHEYSTKWAQGGPIIERWEIDTNKTGLRTWRAKTISIGRLYQATGPTPLIAAMRCYVASKLGDEIDVPEALK